MCVGGRGREGRGGVRERGGEGGKRGEHVKEVYFMRKKSMCVFVRNGPNCWDEQVARLVYHVHAFPQRAACYQFDCLLFEIFVMEGHFSSISLFNRILGAQRINWTLESLFRTWPDVTSGPHFFLT